ncbi:lysophospholipase [Evansella caseinilytica]|uniref:Lysophospholipase n=1 Tax=Evansella caseinilytica TaxID=1503961 RepID=A0A1H3RVU3_9BACI|nr:alpha/beta hydrolase [Evansella caseinilytica]SDZ29782.1 lysophospholipase [Evansella caseinilytica]
MWKWEAKDAKGVIVIVHGAGEYHARYRWTVQQLNRLHYHVIMGDLPGQGTTSGARGHVKSFQQYIAVVKRWLEEARTYQLPIILFGHSMGGLISIHTTLSLKKKELPDVLLLSSPCLGLKNEPHRLKKAAASFLNIVSPGMRFSSGQSGMGTRDEAMRQRDAADPLLIKRVSVRWYKELTKAMQAAQQKADSFPDVPLLVTQSGEDRIVDKEAVRSWFDNLAVTDKYFKEWDGLYHEVLNEPEKNKVLAHLLGFVTIHISLLECVQKDNGSA